MITRLTIANFKSICETTHIDIRPLTLLFGPNGAGKSTILHALHLFRRLLDRGNLDYGILLDGPGSPNLGGLREMTFRQQIDREIVLGLEYELPRGVKELGSFAKPPPTDPLLSEIWDKIHVAEVEFVLHHIDDGQGFHADIKEIRFGLNGEPLATVGIWTNQSTVNSRHPVFTSVMRDGRSDWLESLFDCYMKEKPNAQTGEVRCILNHRLFLSRTALAGERADAEVSDDLTLLQEKEETPNDDWRLLNGVLELALMGPLRLLQDWSLNGFRHIGPLRTIPPDYRLVQRAVETPGHGWYTGAAAWDLILDPSRSRYHTMLLGELNHVIHDIMGLGLDVRTISTRSIEENWSDQYLARSGEAEGLQLPATKHFAFQLHRLVQECQTLSSEKMRERLEALQQIFLAVPKQQKVTLFDEMAGIPIDPRHLAVGVSQMLPIVIGCLAFSEIPLLAVEQPELHIHPRLQCALGDVLAAEVSRPSDNKIRRLILETHSEHLLLRLLRRIRETTLGRVPEDAWPLDPDDVAVVYVEPRGLQSKGSTARRLRIDRDGEFLDPWPNGFFEERGEELFQ